MTGMMHSASAGDSSMQPDLRNLDLAATDLKRESNSEPNSDAWRSEVAARLARYRTRRKPRAPRYPSLLLPFDSAGNWSRTSATTAFSPVTDPVHVDLSDRSSLTSTAPAVDTGSNAELQLESRIGAQHSRQYDREEQTSFANVIEFP